MIITQEPAQSLAALDALLRSERSPKRITLVPYLGPLGLPDGVVAALPVQNGSVIPVTFGGPASG
jgi:hypothetical protein